MDVPSRANATIRSTLPELIEPDQRRYSAVETMGLEPTTPFLQIRPTRTVANALERLRQIRGTIRTPANRREWLRTVPFCYRATSESASRSRTDHRENLLGHSRSAITASRHRENVSGVRLYFDRHCRFENECRRSRLTELGFQHLSLSENRAEAGSHPLLPPRKLVV